MAERGASMLSSFLSNTGIIKLHTSLAGSLSRHFVADDAVQTFTSVKITKQAVQKNQTIKLLINLEQLNK